MKLEGSHKTSILSFLFMMLFVVCKLWILVLHSSLFGRHSTLIDWSFVLHLDVMLLGHAFVLVEYKFVLAWLF